MSEANSSSQCLAAGGRSAGTNGVQHAQDRVAAAVEQGSERKELYCSGDEVVLQDRVAGHGGLISRRRSRRLGPKQQLWIEEVDSDSSDQEKALLLGQPQQTQAVRQTGRAPIAEEQACTAMENLTVLTRAREHVATALCNAAAAQGLEALPAASPGDPCGLHVERRGPQLQPHSHNKQQESRLSLSGQQEAKLSLPGQASASLGGGAGTASGSWAPQPEYDTGPGSAQAQVQAQAQHLQLQQQMLLSYAASCGMGLPPPPPTPPLPQPQPSPRQHHQQSPQQWQHLLHGGSPMAAHRHQHHQQQQQQQQLLQQQDSPLHLSAYGGQASSSRGGGNELIMSSPSPRSSPQFNVYDMRSLSAALSKVQAGTGDVRRVLQSCTFRPRLPGLTKLVSQLTREGNWQKALEVYESLPSIRVVADTTITNAAISACDKGGQWEKAMQLFVSMDARGLSRDAITYSAVISALSKGRQSSTAISLFNHMCEAGIECDAVTWHVARMAFVAAKELGCVGMRGAGRASAESGRCSSSRDSSTVSVGAVDERRGAPA